MSYLHNADSNFNLLYFLFQIFLLLCDDHNSNGKVAIIDEWFKISMTSHLYLSSFSCILKSFAANIMCNTGYSMKKKGLHNILQWVLWWAGLSPRVGPIYRLANIFGQYRYIGISKWDIGIGHIGIDIGIGFSGYRLYRYRPNIGQNTQISPKISAYIGQKPVIG